MNENTETAIGSAAEVATTTAIDGNGAISETAEAREETTQAVDNQKAAETNAATNAPAATADKPGEDSAAAKGAETEPENNSERPKAEDLTVRVAELTRKAVNSKAEAVAAVLGVPEGKLKHVIKLAELDGITIDDKDADAKIKTAVSGVLNELPELAMGNSVGSGTGSPGAFARKTVPDKSPFERGFEQG